MMNKIIAAVFLTDGFEETEAVVTVDILRRAEFDVHIISLTGNKSVKGSHGIIIETDGMFGDYDYNMFSLLILPGGPGRKDYYAHEGLRELLIRHDRKDGYIAAICAAPVFLLDIGILADKQAVCHPSVRERFGVSPTAASPNTAAAMCDGNIMTGRSAGATVEFAYLTIKTIVGAAAADKVDESFII